MRNRRYLCLLFLLPGCSPPKETVFIDLDKIPAFTTPSSPTKPVQVVLPGSVPADYRSLPGIKGTEVENLRAEEKKKIRQEIEVETRSAIGTITERLQDYYQREVDDFYKTESEKLTPVKDQFNLEYLNEIRSVFDAVAKKRGPVLTRLSFLTEFPPPEKLVPIEGEDLSKRELAKRTEIRDLQRAIVALDKEFDEESAKLIANKSDKFEKEVADLQNRLKQKQKEIDARASEEATRLVRRFSSGLSERIFSRYTFQLKEIPTKTVNFPKIEAQPGVPRVPFDRVRLDNEDKTDLAHEVDTFLSLKRYERSPVSTGARDVTTEFIEWRANLKSGHWENWQKLSAPN